MVSSFKRELQLLKKLHNRNISGDYAMKYHLLLPPFLLAVTGCQSDLYYQEQAVESARSCIYKNARELTPEQFAFVRLTPPVILTAPILGRNDRNAVKNSLAGGEKMQICIVWRIPEQETDYLVFGMSGPDMAYWRPLKLIRRRLGKIDSVARSAMESARGYAVSSLHGQVNAADLNTVRFTHPELAETAFALNTENDPAAAPRPWKKVTVSDQELKTKRQLTLLWKISNDRYLYCCGISKDDLSGWKLLMAGIATEDEVAKATVKKLRSSDTFLFPGAKSAAPGSSSQTVKNPPSVKPAGGK